MAVPEQTPYIEHTGNGVTTSFALKFQCESKDHLIVLVDEIEPPIATWSLTGGNVVFTTAPAAGKKIILQRNTPFGRTADYQSFNNSFRPQAVNGDFDRLWLKLQELGVADWLMKLYVDRLHQQQEEKIDDLKGYVDDRDDELRAYLMEEIRKQGVALDQLEDYYNYLMQQLAQVAINKGWNASFIVSADGSTQQEINDFGGAKWRPKPLGYNLGATVKLENGDIVKSTIDGNINNPNLDMTGWAFASRTMLQSIADMLAISNPKDGSSVYVKAYEQGTRLGGGEFTYDASSTETANDVTIFGTGTGRWKRPADQVITPYHAGAVDGTDSIDALERFGAFVLADAGKTQIKLVGNFLISRPWQFNFTGQSSMEWSFKLEAANAMPYIIALKGTAVDHTGRLTVVGVGTTSVYSSMQVGYGVVLNGVQSSKLPSIHAFRFKYFGVIQDERGSIGIPTSGFHNNTNFEFGGVISARDCGCSQTDSDWSNHSTVYNYSNPVHTGSSSAPSQRTTVTVTDLPYDSAINAVFAVINDRVYKVESTDFTNKTVSLFPWMDTPEPASGQIRFVFGGALSNAGSNSGPTKVGLVDAIRCGIGVLDAALYGVNALSVTIQFCGFGCVIGVSGASVAPQSSSYIGFYTEQIYRNAVFMGLGAAQILNRYGEFSGEPFRNCERLNSNSRNGDYGTFADVSSWKRVYMPASTDNMLNGAYYKGRADNQDLKGSALGVSPTNIVPRVYKKNAWTINLQEEMVANRAKGLDDAIIGFIGTGTNAAPTGTFTFNPPSGWTVNGASNAAFSGFGGPALFMCYWDVVAKNVIVSQTTQKIAEQVDSSATDVAALKSDFNALLAKMRAAGLM